MTRYYATIEILSSSRAVVELVDMRGEWAGTGRIDVHHAGVEALYEAGYRYASASAACKGGILDRYSRCESPRDRDGDPKTCGHCHNEGPPPRRGNVIAVEVGAPLPRCTLRPPAHWPAVPGIVLRWLGSGGDRLVFGPCTPRSCPRSHA